MSPQTVVCDTGPVLHLHEADSLGLFSLIGSVWVPTEVDRELARLVENWPAVRPQVRRLQLSRLVRTLGAADRPLAPTAPCAHYLPGRASAAACPRVVPAQATVKESASRSIVATSIVTRGFRTKPAYSPASLTDQKNQKSACRDRRSELCFLP